MNAVFGAGVGFARRLLGQTGNGGRSVVLDATRQPSQHRTQSPGSRSNGAGLRESHGTMITLVLLRALRALALR
jgi:hypothetical protein